MHNPDLTTRKIMDTNWSTAEKETSLVALHTVMVLIPIHILEKASGQKQRSGCCDLYMLTAHDIAKAITKNYCNLKYL